MYLNYLMKMKKYYLMKKMQVQEQELQKQELQEEEILVEEGEVLRVLLLEEEQQLL